MLHWMIRVLKASVQVITVFYIICLCLYGCVCGDVAFLLPNTTSSALHVFFVVFLNLDVGILSFPYNVSGEVGGRL